MTFLRLLFAGIVLLLPIMAAGCKTLDRSTPSGWQGGGGWENWRG